MLGRLRSLKWLDKKEKHNEPPKHLDRPRKKRVTLFQDDATIFVSMYDF